MVTSRETGRDATAAAAAEGRGLNSKRQPRMTRINADRSVGGRGAGRPGWAENLWGGEGRAWCGAPRQPRRSCPYSTPGSGTPRLARAPPKKHFRLRGTTLLPRRDRSACFRVIRGCYRCSLSSAFIRAIRGRCLLLPLPAVLRVLPRKSAIPRRCRAPRQSAVPPPSPPRPTSHPDARRATEIRGAQWAVQDSNL
jgi:hypothetical protein